MFSNKSQLIKRTPENGTDRESFLSLLVDEYLHSSSSDGKYQVLANLANFAYDPINYTYLRDVGVLDIFLHVVKTESDQKLQHFAIAGICNLCIDPQNADYILTNQGLASIKVLLKSNNNNIIANVITTLLYLYSAKTDTEINTPEVVQNITNLQKSEDTRLSNLAAIFLRDVCKTNIVNKKIQEPLQ